MGIEIRGMAPLLQVFDMPTSIAFYRDVLGFEVVTTSKPGAENFGWALLRLNGMELMLNTAYEEDSRPPEPDRAGHRGGPRRRGRPGRGVRVTGPGDDASRRGCRRVAGHRRGVALGPGGGAAR